MKAVKQLRSGQLVTIRVARLSWATEIGGIAMSIRDKGVLLRRRLGKVNGEWRMWSNQKERTPERAARMRQLNDRRIELAIEIVDLDRSDRSNLVVRRFKHGSRSAG